MNRMTRTALIGVLVVMLVAVYAGSAVAETKIGVIDPQRVLYNHPDFKATQQRIKQMSEQKQSEAKMAIDSVSDNQQKAQIYQKKRQEAAQEEQSLMEPLFKDVDMAIRTVAKARGFTVILDKAQVFYGGTEVTEAVIQELKRQATQ
ncbi:MAG: OmpH family outer membrane protein [Synergistales bacterium]|nr:OmpH family outer membrane protein [Synergistales bacterium]